MEKNLKVITFLFGWLPLLLVTSFGKTLLGDWHQAKVFLKKLEDWLFVHLDYPILFCMALAFAFSFLLLPTVWDYLKKFLEYKELKNMPATLVPLVSLHTVATSIYKDSDWAWKEVAKLNLWEVVKSSVAREIERAALNGEVRVVGCRPNSYSLEEIEKGYWRYGRILEARLWHENAGQAASGPLGVSVDVPTYLDLQIPMIDFERAWSNASFLRKGSSIIFLAIKRYAWWPIKNLLGR
jgi:hypothetical protein